MTGPQVPRHLLELEAQIGALVASHGLTERARDLGRYRTDPVAFCREILKGKPWSMQQEIMYAVRDNPLTVVQSCNGAGKDWTAAALALWWSYAVGGYVLITGPTERQVKAVVFGELHRAFARGTELPGQLFELALKLPGDELRGVIGFTSNDMSKITGFHAPKLLIILTEAQGVEPSVWEGLLADATGETSRILAVGNPLAAIGRFFEVCQSPHWTRFKISAFDTPNVIEQREVVPGAVTQAFVDRIAQEFGVGSSIYQSRVLGEFPDDAAESLVKRSWCEAAIERWHSGALENQAKGWGLTAGLDVARFGADQSALAVRDGPILRHLVVWNQLDTMETVARTRAELATLGVRVWPYDGQHLAGELIIDEAGVGAGVMDRARELKWTVKGFISGSSPSPADEDRFANLRASSYWRLRTLLERGEIALLPDPRLVDELCSTLWKVNLAGKIALESKDDIRARLGRSPDRADAVAMAFSNYRREINPDDYRTVKK